MNRKLGDYDRWFKTCNRCGYDTGKASMKTKNICWRCGNILQRDYSDRALKTHNKQIKQTQTQGHV